LTYIPKWDNIMKIANIEKIIHCYEKHSISKPAFLAWVAEAKNTKWKTTSDIKNRYSSADFLPGNRVVFNIKGKKYRLVVKINYRTSTIDVRFADTHAEYNKINAETV